MSVKNLPPSLTSRQMNIFPVVYCYASDVKKYGFDAMLLPLLSDLKALEDGVQMTVNAKQQTVHAAVVMWSGDNLGNHQIFGFSPNFSSNLCCHFCYEVVLRSKAMHNADCKQLYDQLTSKDHAKKTGVYRKCSLSELKYFSIPENVCPDAMHDILEGCLQYELKLVLRQIILVDKILSLEEFNSRMNAFRYGVDSKNKPQPLSIEKLRSDEKKMGMNATQAWCFARYFCLLVGDVVCTDYAYMHLIYLLLDIIDDIFAPNITVSMTYRMEELISQHHELFSNLFPSYTFIPKQHFLIHYPSKIRNLGPCVQYWCMRFESKHASANDFARLIHNFKNVCKSIAWQEQIKLCVDWMLINHSAAVDVGHGSAILPCTLSVPNDVFVAARIPLFEEIYVANHVKINGSKYVPGNVVVLPFQDELPVFGLIVLIAYFNNAVTFIVQKQLAVEYDSALHAYEVSNSGDFAAVDYTELADWHPLSLHFGFGKYRQCRYVVPRYEMMIKVKREDG